MSESVKEEDGCGDVHMYNYIIYVFGKRASPSPGMIFQGSRFEVRGPRWEYEWNGLLVFITSQAWALEIL